ncbi:hypothetical protein QK292_17890 [Arthrobacter sp. AL08]|uniref:hypothetical protein n=1 Tax=unclassified Arthrobacter TaxID=235627 RepID=UPI00249AD899|nr:MULTISPECIES: hypothetical protein [unclassified Arthrobacter]MDI3243424.1 hypothetical protein [Arthrobacter sp. AL05]MDI3279424.1 hypothetical protein [Arthrobacter sp. AL08]
MMLTKGPDFSAWRDRLECLDCVRHVAIREPEEAVAATMVNRDDACGEQNAKMFARRRRGHIRNSSEITGRDRSAAKQRSNNPATRGVT